MKKYEAFKSKKISAPELHAILEKAKTSFTNIPVDIEGLIRFLEIEIDTKPDFKKMKVLGSISIKENRPVIWVNRISNQMEERKRFTLAHELGHFMMHIAPLSHWSTETGFLDKEIGFNRDDDWNHDEMEANRFAAQLLMPSDAVEREYRQVGTEDKTKVIENLAQKFQVSKLAMKYRLETLGLM
ncbi:ImmA/IrrE family metallo-endopeptidase [Sulfurimonas sp. HSL1-6]|uniref:ImmA/IrrE family metallo-endopeptidase n=1 Tax=Thiomicrolovo immobilis TaxID=3131935 RepID=UPI0031FA17D5